MVSVASSIGWTGWRHGRRDAGEGLGEAERTHAAVLLVPRDVEEVDRVERRLAPGNAGPMPQVGGKA